jgi:hypothetical protein
MPVLVVERDAYSIYLGVQRKAVGDTPKSRSELLRYCQLVALLVQVYRSGHGTLSLAPRKTNGAREETALGNWQTGREYTQIL